MRKVNLLRCDVARDASMQDLFSELSDTRVALNKSRSEEHTSEL